MWNLLPPEPLISNVGAGILIELKTVKRVLTKWDLVSILVKSTSKLR